MPPRTGNIYNMKRLAAEPGLTPCVLDTKRLVKDRYTAQAALANSLEEVTRLPGAVVVIDGWPSFSGGSCSASTGARRP